MGAVGDRIVTANTNYTDSLVYLETKVFQEINMSYAHWRNAQSSKDVNWASDVKLLLVIGCSMVFFC